MKKNGGLSLLMAMLLSVFLCVSCAKEPAPDSALNDDGVESGDSMGDSQGDTPDYGTIYESSVVEDNAGPDESAVNLDDDVTGLERIFFEFDQYILTPEARDILARNVRFMEAHPDTRIIIEGHCDERGSDEYNLALGERRARAVQTYLVTLGVPAEQLSIISYGEEIPLDPESSEEAWARNRRADFKQAQ